MSHSEISSEETTQKLKRSKSDSAINYAQNSNTGEETSTNTAQNSDTGEETPTKSKKERRKERKKLRDEREALKAHARKSTKYKYKNKLKKLDPKKLQRSKSEIIASVIEKTEDKPGWIKKADSYRSPRKKKSFRNESPGMILKREKKAIKKAQKREKLRKRMIQKNEQKYRNLLPK